MCSNHSNHSDSYDHSDDRRSSLRDISRLASLLALASAALFTLISLSSSSSSHAGWPSVGLIAQQATTPVQSVSDTSAESQADEPKPSEPKPSEPKPSEPKPSESELTIAVISELRGYIEPCGCTIDLKLGAIERLVAQVDALRAQGPTLVLSAGSALFEHPTLASHLERQEVLKAKLIRQILHGRLHVDAHLAGPNELAGGDALYQKLLKAYPLPEVGLNAPLLAPQGQARVIERGGVKVGVFGLAGPSTDHDHLPGQVSAGHGAGHGASSQAVSTPNHLTPQELQALTREAVKTLRAQGARVIIGLSTLDRAALRKLAEVSPEVDLWVLAQEAQEEEALSPIVFAQDSSQKAYIVEAGDRGRHFAALHIKHAELSGELSYPKGERISAQRKLERRIKLIEPFSRTNPFMKRKVDKLRAELEALKTAPVQSNESSERSASPSVDYKLIPIKDTLPADAEISKLVEAYHQAAKASNDCESNPIPPQPAPENGNGYAGNAECELCHPMATKFWSSTRHSRAWDTLVKADKTSDAGCVGCHVTGWQEPGGSNLCNNEKLRNVGCESCHGPAAKHAEVGGGEAYVKLKVPAEVCTQCHNELHSPKFNYERYLKEVIGPGHGAPLETETP